MQVNAVIYCNLIPFNVLLITAQKQIIDFLKNKLKKHYLWDAFLFLRVNLIFIFHMAPKKPFRRTFSRISSFIHNMSHNTLPFMGSVRCFNVFA